MLPGKHVRVSVIRPKNILVAEDSLQDFILLRTAFQDAGLPHHLHNVSDGLQLVAYLKAEPPFTSRPLFPFPDLLVLDIHMPRADAFGVLGFLRERPEIQMPVVILSGSMPPINVDQALRLGAAACFDKPAHFAGLITLVQTIHDRWLAK